MMKISQEMRAQLETVKKNARTGTESKQPFNRIVQSQVDQMKQDELQRVMEQINVQGERLAKSRNFRDLATFKRLVKDFLKEAVSTGLDLQKSHNFSMTGQSNEMVIVKKVDKKLLELTEDVLNEEKR
ncbi:YaaR family protein [Paracerasibacillus soli]|uniref:YaaR family protein n=1 Tax=Paracerasibacillus soli TaxID=480284 RepID=A0ABU5CUR9_9BACI|nr:YaaR family protein [Virgibacillus soli]MDY0409985.1 YaaR family protein [Virgibacillus soli]